MKINKKGFTLIELLVVVALIGILSTLVLANLNAARERGRDTRRKADVRNIQTALSIFYNKFGVYPTNSISNEIVGCGAGGTSTCEWDAEWSADGSVYMSKLPGDPIATQTYRYTRSDPDTYTFQVCLENKSDTTGQSTTETTWCESAWMYEVTL